MKKLLKLVALIGIFFSGSSFAHNFSFDQCLEASSWVGIVVETRNQKVPYDQVEDAIRNHLESLRVVKPEKAFVLDPADDNAFFSATEKAYNSNRTADEEETDYITSCVARITPN